MPIRFRCVYCDKLLGIARRKAGAVVDCPHCAEKLIVPTPDPDDIGSPGEDESARGSGDDADYAERPKGSTEEKAVAGGLFERADFDARSCKEGQPSEWAAN